MIRVREIKEDVVSFDVAVDDVVEVQPTQRFCDLKCDPRFLPSFSLLSSDVSEMRVPPSNTSSAYLQQRHLTP